MKFQKSVNTLTIQNQTGGVTFRVVVIINYISFKVQKNGLLSEGFYI